MPHRAPGPLSQSSTRILAEIQSAIHTYPDWAALNLTKAPSIHIAIMSEPFLSYVFDHKKTVESRFSLNKIAPYGKVRPGDIVFMKAGLVVGYFTVSWVKEFDLQEYPIAALAQKYGRAICGDERFWQRKSFKRYATLMGIGNIQKLTPIAITKTDRRAWVAAN